MAITDLKLPGDFEPGKNYLLKGQTLIAWRKALMSDRATPGPGLLETQGDAGRIFRVVFPPSQYPPFAVKEITKDGSDYKLLLQPGRVIVANPQAAAEGGDGYDYFVPEINGNPMDEKLPDGGYPTLSIGEGEGVYVKIARDAEGLVIPPVELVADAQDEDSDFYQPVDPDDSGHESDSDLIRILYLDVEQNEVEIKTWRESDIQLSPFLWTGENLGEGAGVFKEHNETEGVYQFRSLKGCWGITAAEEGDSVNLDVIAENIGTDGDGGSDSSSGEGATILVDRDEQEEEGDEDICEGGLKFKSLAQGAGDDAKQIRVTNEDDKVRIHGNGMNGLLQFLDCRGTPVGHLSWEDGLITTSGQIIATLGDCPPEDTTEDIPT